jgi:hypothetical protein
MRDLRRRSPNSIAMQAKERFNYVPKKGKEIREFKTLIKIHRM